MLPSVVLLGLILVGSLFSSPGIVLVLRCRFFSSFLFHAFPLLFLCAEWEVIFRLPAWHPCMNHVTVASLSLGLAWPFCSNNRHLSIIWVWPSVTKSERPSTGSVTLDARNYRNIALYIKLEDVWYTVCDFIWRFKNILLQYITLPRCSGIYNSSGYEYVSTGILGNHPLSSIFFIFWQSIQ